MRKIMIPIVAVLLVIAAFVLPIVLAVDRKISRLNKAIREGDTEEVRDLLEKGVDPNRPDLRYYVIDVNTYYPLTVACEVGNYEMVALLIDYGASPILKDRDVFTPLERAVTLYCSDTIPIVQLLLEKDGDTRFHKEEGDNARRLYLMTAAFARPRKRHANTENDSLHDKEKYDEETAKKIVEVVKLLIGRMEHFDVNEGNLTLLMRAASVGNLALAEYLLSIGADKTLRSSNGKTAFDMAFENGHVEVANLLRPSTEI